MPPQHNLSDANPQSGRWGHRRIAQLKSAGDFRRYLESLGVDLPFDEEMQAGPGAPLGQPYHLSDGFTIGNRFCIHPMEGWDGKPDGKASEFTARRWRHFGESGAKLIWGCEAAAVRHDGRANPNQLVINAANLDSLAALRKQLVETHEQHFGTSQDLLVGLQLTHSGRYARPNRKDRPEPVILYHHPYLDERMGLPADYPVMTDSEIRELIACFVNAAELASAAGFG